MPSLIRDLKDFWIGALYLAIGTLGLFIGRGYSFGTTARMGPGYFPLVVSGLLVVFGLIAIARSCSRAGPPVGPLAWKATLLIVWHRSRSRCCSSRRASSWPCWSSF